MNADALVADLARATIGRTFNFYRDGDGAALRRRRLSAYLARKADAPLLLVGEAPGHRGTRVSGVPLTSERQLTGSGPAEATATIVHRVLGELGLEDGTLLWNVVPTHPHAPGRPDANRLPTRAEVEASRPYLDRLTPGRRVIPVGRLAHAVLGGPYVRHPSHGGASAFRAGLLTILAPIDRKGSAVDENLVREHAEAHGRAMVEGDLRRAASDVAEEFQPRLPEIMSHVPRQITAADVVGIDEAGDDEYFSRIRYSGDDKATTLQARWADRGGRPMIVDIQVAE